MQIASQNPKVYNVFSATNVREYWPYGWRKFLVRALPGFGRLNKYERYQ